jgi:hypothetical protein
MGRSDKTVSPLYIVKRTIALGFLLSLSCAVLSLGACYLNDVTNPLPPGFSDFFSFSPRSWSVEMIEEFIDRPFPPSAQDIWFEGRIGLLGSYGLLPNVEFSFRANLQEAADFAHSFCEGVLHEGYDPLNAVDSAEPSSNAILIATGGFFYYSYSLNSSSNVMGNRCIRLDERTWRYSLEPKRWFEEITLEISPTLATVKYRLPYQANSSSPPASYPVGYHVNPFGNQFSLYVSGIAEGDNAVYLQTYPTLCFSTRGWGLNFDSFSFDPKLLEPYKYAEITLFID